MAWNRDDSWDFASDARWDEKALYYIPYVVGPVSCLSSLYVMYLILRPKNRTYLKYRPRDQFLLGLALLDVLASFGFSFSTTPGPSSMQDLDNHPLPTYGTINTCTAQAVLAHMVIGIPLYNSSLCIYYLFSIRYQLSDAVLMKRMVPIVHFICLGWTFGTCVVAWHRKHFNYAGYLGCWLHDVDGEACAWDERNCDRPTEGADDFSNAVVAAPVGLSGVVIILSMITIYSTVRTIERRTQQYTARNATVVHAEEGAVASSSNTHKKKNKLSTPLTRRTAETGLLYAGAYFLVWLPLTITYALSTSGKSHGSVLYKVWRVISVTTFPLQGYFNMLIFTSHVWLKWLKKNEGCAALLRSCTQCNCCGKKENDDRDIPRTTNVADDEKDDSQHDSSEDLQGFDENSDLEASRDLLAVKVTVDHQIRRASSIQIHPRTSSIKPFRIRGPTGSRPSGASFMRFSSTPLGPTKENAVEAACREVQQDQDLIMEEEEASASMEEQESDEKEVTSTSVQLPQDGLTMAMLDFESDSEIVHC